MCCPCTCAAATTNTSPQHPTLFRPQQRRDCHRPLCPPLQLPPPAAAAPAQPKDSTGLCPGYNSNNNGRRCLEMCPKHGLFVANTYFQRRDVRTASFLSNTGRYWATLDLIQVIQRCHSLVLDTRVLPSATARAIDHRLVACDVALWLQQPGMPAATQPPCFMMVPRDSPAQREFASAVAVALHTHTEHHPHLGSSDLEQQEIVKAVTGAAMCGRTTRTSRSEQLPARTAAPCC